VVRNVVTVRPDTDVAEAIKLLAEHDEADRQIWLELLSRLPQQSWTDFGSRNITVNDRVVHLLVGPPVERKALLALAESVLWVSQVCDEMLAAYKAGSPIKPGEPGLTKR
jgi:CBS domain-containing protein